MGKYNDELVKAGVMLAGEGLHPSAKGARVKFSKGKLTVTDGPFTEAKELICGFWIWQVKTLEEAIEWAKRIPNPDQEEKARSKFVRCSRWRTSALSSLPNSESKRHACARNSPRRSRRSDFLKLREQPFIIHKEA